MCRALSVAFYCSLGSLVCSRSHIRSLYRVLLRMQQKVFELVVSRVNTLSIAGVIITSEAREFDRLQVSKWSEQLTLGENGCRTRGRPTSCRNARARTASVPRRMRIVGDESMKRMIVIKCFFHRVEATLLPGPTRCGTAHVPRGVVCACIHCARIGFPCRSLAVLVKFNYWALLRTPEPSPVVNPTVTYTLSVSVTRSQTLYAGTGHRRNNSRKNEATQRKKHTYLSHRVQCALVGWVFPISGTSQATEAHRINFSSCGWHGLEAIRRGAQWMQVRTMPRGTWAMPPHRVGPGSSVASKQ
jgi:hypothetical protein